MEKQGKPQGLIASGVFFCRLSADAYGTTSLTVEGITLYGDVRNRVFFMLFLLKI